MKSFIDVANKQLPNKSQMWEDKKADFESLSQIRISRLIEKAMWGNEGITPEKLRDMVARSTRFTHVSIEANRRYHDYLFMVEGNILYSVKKVRTVTDDIITLQRPEPEVREVTGGVARKPIVVAELKPVAKPVPALLVQAKDHKPKAAVVITNPCEKCEGLGVVGVFDECPDCHGDWENCSTCDEGLVPASITCPECKGRKSKN